MTRRLLLYFMFNMHGINIYPNPCATKNKQANKKQTSKGPRPPPKKNPNPTIKSCHSLSIYQPHISGWRQWRERNVRKCVWLGTSRFPESVPRAGKPRMAETGSLPCCFPPSMAFPIKCPCSVWPRFSAWCLGPAAPAFYFLLFSHPFISRRARSLHWRSAPEACAKMSLALFSVASAQLWVDRWGHHLRHS